MQQSSQINAISDKLDAIKQELAISTTNLSTIESSLDRSNKTTTLQEILSTVRDYSSKMCDLSATISTHMSGSVSQINDIRKDLNELKYHHFSRSLDRNKEDESIKTQLDKVETLVSKASIN
mmetsp:Transcript_117160/g.251900  ORF Transcript_117160/g.251900 Transcript_117160/m.251900 type:complete len:122 (+) Transcript_117160:1481-1846(+)